MSSLNVMIIITAQSPVCRRKNIVLRIVSLKCPVWPGAADKHVSLIYGAAVKWLLRVVNIRPVSFWRQLHRAGEEKGQEDGTAS